MGYEIRYVTQLPDGYEFVLVALPDKVVILFRDTAVCPHVLEEAWAAFRALEAPEFAAAV